MRLCYRSNRQARQAGTVPTMFHIIWLMAASISLAGCVRVLARPAQHIPYHNKVNSHKLNHHELYLYK